MTGTDQIAPALVVALNELRDITRDKTANVGSYSYRYADLAQVVQHAREVLTKHGLAVQQFAHSDGVGSVSVTCTFWHISGQSIESPPLTMAAKGGPQDIGSAITYARRYALTAFLGLANDDDDGAGAQQAAEADAASHPLSDRVAAVQTDMKRLTDTEKNAIKDWADGRKLSGAALLADATWLERVETYLNEANATPVSRA